MFGSDRKQIGMKLIQHQVENHLMILYMQKLNTLLKDSMILKFHINQNIGDFKFNIKFNARENSSVFFKTLNSILTFIETFSNSTFSNI